MEALDNHRFPQRFTQSVLALGMGAVLLSFFRLPAAKLFIPILLLAVIAANVSSTYTIRIPRSGERLSPLDSFALLAVMLFGGEAALLFAAVTALCTSLRFGKNRTRVLFNSAVTVASIAIVIWTLRFTYGPIIEADHINYSADFLEAVCIATLIQAGVTSTIIEVGSAYQINRSPLINWGRNFLWTFVICLAGAIAAGVAATVILAVGFTSFVAASVIVALACTAFRIYRRNTAAGAPQAERYGPAIKDSSERFRSAFDHAAIGMALVSSEGRWLQVNRSLCRLLGYPERELIATDFLKVTHPDDLTTALAHIKQLIKGQVPTFQMEKRYIHKEGHEVWVLWSVSLARDTYGSSPHLIFQVQDITDRKRAEERLIHDAFHDALTGLPNRALFMDHLKLAIARSKRREDQKFAVIYLDCDRFKIINDSLGHTVGDQLLVCIAKRLQNCMRPEDTIARLGGDEFTILIEGIEDFTDAICLVERIQKELALPFDLGGREVFTTVSMGIALSSSDYVRAEDILRDADTAMYRAKSSGKARHEIFDKAMHAHAMKLLQLETDLRQAVEREEFVLHYQPIVSLEGGTLRGFEALLRWRHPELGFISPADFIPVAEDTGLIIPIGAWALREACHQMRRWREALPADPPLFMSVNLSGKQLAQPGLVGEVASTLRETRLDPHSLKLEITESVVMENLEAAMGMLKELRSLGAQLSIDDFGTGYSSLSYLHRFPINTLKIDRSFVTKMTENNENAEIVRTIVVLAQNLGMDVVAEGVERNEQLVLLRALGCEFGQGYLFSKPVMAEAAERFIRDNYSPLVTALDVGDSLPIREAAVA